MAHGLPAETTREPSDGPIGAVLRQGIEGRLAMDRVSLALAFAGDRADHVFNDVQGVAGKLRAGRWTLSDRYLASAVAYQLSAETPLEWLLAINRFAPTPDLTIFVDTDPEVCIARINERRRGFELFHDLAKLRRVRDGYRHALERREVVGDLIVLDGDRPVEDLFADLLARFEEWLGTHEIAPPVRQTTTTQEG